MEANENWPSRKISSGLLDWWIFRMQVLCMKKTISSFVIDASGKVVDGMDGEAVNVAAEFKKPAEDQVHPVFVYTADDGSKRLILPLYGNGLWDKIWGYIALEEDMNTIAGIAMDHKGETPGLGCRDQR